MRAEYSYCRDYLIKNGKPWFPVMGEMHYSRYRKEWWEESLAQNKGGRSFCRLGLCDLDSPRGRGKCV